MSGVREWVREADEEVLLADGLDDAFVGLLTRCGTSDPIACYDEEKVIEILMKRDGMTEEEAEEFFDFNIAGAYVGPRTPFYLRRYARLHHQAD